MYSDIARTGSVPVMGGRQVPADEGGIRRRLVPAYSAYRELRLPFGKLSV